MTRTRLGEAEKAPGPVARFRVHWELPEDWIRRFADEIAIWFRRTTGTSHPMVRDVLRRSPWARKYR